MASFSPNNSYVVYTSYSGPDAPGELQAWLLPPQFTYGKQSPPVPLALPNLWTGLGDPSTLKLSNPDFAMAVTFNPPPTRASVTLKLTLTGLNAWNTRPASRAALRSNFLAFVAGIETAFELSSPPLLVPGATAQIAATLIQYLPLPLGELLLYGCGLETGIGTGAPASVDLRPGMRLRSEPSQRQYLAPPNQAFSAYVATGSLAWHVSTNVANGTAVQAFDAFLGTIAAPQLVPPQPPSGPVNSLIDLQQSGSAFRHHRLIYPQNVIAAGAPGSSSASTNVQITGAATLAALRSNPALTATFFGRDVVIPEIAVLLQLGNNANPESVYLPVGTTVANLLERYTTWLPVAQAQRVVSLSRLALTTNANPGAVAYFTVQFAAPNALVNDVQAFALPLLAGDYVTIAFGSPS